MFPDLVVQRQHPAQPFERGLVQHLVEQPAGELVQAVLADLLAPASIRRWRAVKSAAPWAGTGTT